MTVSPWKMLSVFDILCLFFFSGLMNKPPSLHSSTSDSAVPAICKDLIGSAVARLRSCQSAEENESLADKLTLDLLVVHSAVRSIADLYEHLDDDGQENRKRPSVFNKPKSTYPFISVNIQLSMNAQHLCHHSATQRASFRSVCVYVNSVCLQY